MDERVLTAREQGVGWITLNQPERRNAISLAMWEHLAAVADAFAEDDDVRVVVVRGAGGKAFAAGADISRFDEERATPEQVLHYDATMARTHQALAGMPQPTIAMIQGSCMGGGVALALDCDLRFCDESAVFGIPAARLGVGYGYEGVRRLMDLVGPAAVKEIFYTGRRFSSGEAARMGLVNGVFQDAELEASIRALAATIAENAPLAIRCVKGIVAEVLKDPAERDLSRCDRLVRDCFESEDYIEGRRAFLEKRRPVFKGR
jgi:enoyl-CoA hydratase/carnithine racemase